jgi:hypothetical protein
METQIKGSAITPPMSASFPVKPAHFWTVFSEALRADWKNPEKQLREKYNTREPWTLYISDFIERLAVEFGCITEREYFARIDVCYFNRSGGDWTEWAMEVAIEVENDVNWTEELSKLLMVNAGLKVLIAYENDPDRIAALLSEFTRIHASRKYHTKNCGWLFIFGSREIPSTRDFVAFTFNGTEISEITGGRQTIL